MPVPAGFYSVIIQVSTVQRQYPGGLERYAADCPNSTFSSDMEICRVGFMAWADTEAFLHSLEPLGFSVPSNNVAVIREDKGPVFPCDWLEFSQYEGASVVRLAGSQNVQLVAPPGWKPEVGTTVWTAEKELKEKFELVGVEDGVEEYYDPKTRERIYVGRTNPPQARRRWWQFWK